jgi:hypothetical protein
MNDEQKHPRKTPPGYYVTVGSDGVCKVHDTPQPRRATCREATAWGSTKREAVDRATTDLKRERQRVNARRPRKKKH